MDDKDRAVDDTLSDPSMLATLMAAAAAYAVQRGLSLETVADAAGLEPRTLVAAPDRVPEDAVSRILGLLQERFPDEPVAFEMVAASPLHFLGPLEPVARLVPDLRAGLETFVRYRSVLSTNAVLDLIESSPGPLLRLEHPNDDAFGPQNAEMGIAMGARAIGEVFGAPDAVRGVWFRHSAQAPVERYSEVFSAPVHFDAPFNALLLHAHRLSDPVDPDAGERFRVLRAHLELVRQQLEREGDPAELLQIRDAAARNAAHGDYRASALAGRLGMSLRTLQRRVDEFDTSVSSVIDDVREANARQLVAGTDMSLFQISHTLGYSTESAFRRAFRRWTGQSPSEHRRALASTTERS
ncbi:MAG: AraC family transcriptional regulator ligand-binding domain-containing protein [Actinomycetota bacterium]